MPIYMKVTKAGGGVIKGDVTAAGHEGWIELSSVQLGVARRINNPSGRGSNREGSAPSVSEIVITKDEDSASNELFRLSLWGDGAKVQIDFVRTDPDQQPRTYMQVTLENTLIA